MLNLEKVTYDGEDLYPQAMEALLSSPANDLMFIAGA